MTLRCRPGDMAIVIRSDSGFEGYMVDVNDLLKDDIWSVSMKCGYVPGIGRLTATCDAYLLPIRPGDLDEKEETERELTV